jgi:hypothetical protein
MDTVILNGYVTSCYETGHIYRACTTGTCLMMLTGKVTATVRKDHHKHFDMTPIDPQVGISCLPRIPWGAA